LGGLFYRKGAGFKILGDKNRKILHGPFYRPGIKLREGTVIRPALLRWGIPAGLFKIEVINLPGEILGVKIGHGNGAGPDRAMRNTGKGKGCFSGIGKTVKGSAIGKGIFHTQTEPGILPCPFGKGAYQGPGQEFLEPQGRIRTDRRQSFLIPGGNRLPPQLFQHKYIQKPFKKGMGFGKPPGSGIPPGNPACLIDYVGMAKPVQKGVGHKTQGIGPQRVNPLLPPVEPDILLIRRRVRKPHFEKGRGKHSIPPAVKQGAIFQSRRTGRLVMIKDIRPLTPQDKGGLVGKPDFFQGLVGHHTETPAYTPVYPAYYIFPKKGMQNLGGHIINIPFLRTWFQVILT
jgi:hypothetical protein